MEPNTYSEKDIQDYAAGIFSGNTEAFEAFLQSSPPARQQAEAYKSLYQLLSREQIPSLSFNLADKVAGKIGWQEQVRDARLFRLLCLLLVFLCAGGVLLVQRQYVFSATEPVLAAVSAGVLLLFVSGFGIMEIKQQQKTFISASSAIN